MIEKAVALVVRRSSDGHELLAFRHPLAGVQIPKGTVEEGELPELAVMRELEEESGLALDCNPRPIGQWDRVITHGEVHRWHMFLVEPPGDLADSWSHVATGSVEEDGLTFAFHWLPVNEALADSLEPLFGACATVLVSALADRGVR